MRRLGPGAVLLLALSGLTAPGGSGALAAPGAPSPRPLPELLAESWRWRTYDRKEGLVSSTVLALYQDRHGYIYAATSGGLCRYDLWEWTRIGGEGLAPAGGAGWRFVESQSELYLASPRGFWSVQSGAILKPLREGGPCFAARSELGEVFVIDVAARELLEARGGALEPLDGTGGLPAGDILDYAIDPYRGHWFATSAGLFLREGSRRPWRELQDREKEPGLDAALCRRFLPLESKADDDRPVGARPAVELWALFEERSEQGTKHSLARFQEGLWLPQAARLDFDVESLARDARGRILATTEDGRLFVSDDGRAWSPAPQLGLSPGPLQGVLVDASGVAWFRRGAQGLASFDPEDGRWEQLPTLAQEPYPNVLSLLESDSGEVWMGLTRGVTRIDAAGAPSHFESVQGARLEKVTALGEDGLGRIWVGSAESFRGAYSFDPGFGGWTQLSSAGFSDRRVRRIVRVRSGELWLLTVEEGEGERILYRIGLGSSFELEPVPAPGLTGVINDILEARDGALWLATDGGLLKGRVDGEFRLETRLGKPQGLLSAQVWAMAEGPDGSLWICYPSSAGGISRWKDGKATTYDDAGGLGTTEVWSIATIDQQVWFGTGRGLLRYDGECWYNLPVASWEPRPVHVWPIAESRRHADSILVGTFGLGAYRLHLEERRRPRFTRTEFPASARADGTVTFRWDASDYRDNTPRDALLFRSRADDEPWSGFSTMRERSLHGLTPGEHTFEVEVRNLLGSRNRVEAVHRFVVPAPRRWWLPTAVVGGGLVVVFGFAVARGLAQRRRMRRRLDGLLRGHPGPVLFLDASGRVLEYNGRQPELLGSSKLRRSDIVGRPVELLAVFSSPTARSLLASLRRGQAGSPRTVVFEVDGVEERRIELRGHPLDPPGERGGEAVVWVEEVTEAVRSLALSEVRQRIARIRAFSARMASELEPLATHLSEGAGEGLPPEARESLKRARRLRDILAGFAGEEGSQAGGRGPAEVAPLLSSVVAGAGGPESSGGPGGPEGSADPGGVRLRSGVELKVRAPVGLWDAAIEPRVLSCVLREVALNAIESLPEKGEVVLRAANLQVDGDPGGLPAGPYVLVTVKDNGVGMDEDQLQRLFEPLYFTKPRGQGPGIGLALAYARLVDRGGDIRVRSRVGQGTTVELFLPAWRGERRPAGSSLFPDPSLWAPEASPSPPPEDAPPPEPNRQP